MKVFKLKNEQLPQSDLQLWAELKKGCTEALGNLYNLYIDELFAYGIRYSKDRGYVMDCIHDLFFDLYKYRANLAMTDNVKYYLLRSLKRRIHKTYSGKIQPLQADPIADINELQKNHTASFEDELILNEGFTEKISRLTTALQTLTKTQKKGLFLRFNQDKSYEEIAEIMKTSIPSARTTVYRAIRMLREHPLSLLTLLYSYLFS